MLIAIGNSGDAALAAAAEVHLDDPSPQVRGAAVWALGELLPPAAFAKVAARHRAAETDAGVTAEWNAMSEPRFFKTQAEWRAWLEKNHATANEMLVGFHKTKSDAKGITYKQAVDEALCFGWIDAVRRGGDLTWTIRFTPRKAKSIWSQVNIRRIEELIAAGRRSRRGSRRLQGSRSETPEPLFVRESRRRPGCRFARRRFASNKPAWDELQCDAAVLPPAGDLVGDERQARRDQSAGGWRR